MILKKQTHYSTIKLRFFVTDLLLIFKRLYLGLIAYKAVSPPLKISKTEILSPLNNVKILLSPLVANQLLRVARGYLVQFFSKTNSLTKNSL